jgi:DNA-binding transcriptional MerR regulator
MTIGEVAERRSGKRVYGESVLKRLALIEVAKAAGFELDETAVLLASLEPRRPAPGWQIAAGRKQVQIRAQLKTLMRMDEILDVLKGCSCGTLDDCAAGFIAAIANEPLDTPVKPEDLRRVARRRFASRRLKGEAEPHRA